MGYFEVRQLGHQSSVCKGDFKRKKTPVGVWIPEKIPFFQKVSVSTNEPYKPK
jgi:hypothetical protein